MTLDLNVTDETRTFVGLVWRVFRDRGQWPTATEIERSLRRRLPPKADTYAVMRAIPTVVGSAFPGGGSEARITPIAIEAVVGSDAAETLADFFRAFAICRDRFQAAADDEEVWLCSGDLGELGYTELRIRRTYQLLKAEMLVAGAPGSYETDDGPQYGWNMAIYHTINRYREASTLDEYLTERREELNGRTTMPGFVAENATIQPLIPVRYQSPSPHEQEIKATPKREILVVHGRDLDARGAMFDFLRALDLRPLDWEEWVRRTEQGVPYIGTVLDTAFAHAQAVIVLLTPDDFAMLHPRWVAKDDADGEAILRPQARPNVLFEAGMAFGHAPDRTVLVQLGRMRSFSDIAGRHLVVMDDTPQKRAALRGRLMATNCPIDETTDAWLTTTPFPMRGDD